MKANTALRILDLAVQLCMFFPLFMTGKWTPQESVICTYFSLGAAQVLSLFAHWLFNPAGRARRHRYSRIVTGFLIPAILALGCLLPGIHGAGGPGLANWLSMSGAGILYLECLVLLFTAPVLAIWYFWICIGELAILRAAISHRREIHWKL